MIHNLEYLIDWLRMLSQYRDRVIYDALNNHQCNPTIVWGEDADGKKRPVVTATTRSGCILRIGICLHPVSQEPFGFFRIPAKN